MAVLENSVIAPTGVIRPTPMLSVNHRLPSGPAVMPSGVAPPARPYSVTVPDVVILPIRPLAMHSVNHMLPSGPAAMPAGWLPMLTPVEYSVIVPAVVILPIAPPVVGPNSVNHRLPSGPAAM